MYTTTPPWYTQWRLYLGEEKKKRGRERERGRGRERGRESADAAMAMPSSSREDAATPVCPVALPSKKTMSSISVHRRIDSVKFGLSAPQELVRMAELEVKEGHLYRYGRKQTRRRLRRRGGRRLDSSRDTSFRAMRYDI